MRPMKIHGLSPSSLHMDYSDVWLYGHSPHRSDTEVAPGGDGGSPQNGDHLHCRVHMHHCCIV